MQIDNIVLTQNCTGSNWGIACHSNNANGCCFDSCELLLLHLVIYTSPKFCEKLRNYTCSATCSCKYKQTLRNLEEWWGCHYHSTYLFKMKIRWNQCLESYVSSLHPNLDKTSASFEASRQPLIGFLQLVCSLLAFSESELLVYTSYTSYIYIIYFIYIYISYISYIYISYISYIYYITYIIHEISWILCEMWIYCLRKETGYYETLTKSSSCHCRYHSIPAFPL